MSIEGQEACQKKPNWTNLTEWNLKTAYCQLAHWSAVLPLNVEEVPMVP